MIDPVKAAEAVMDSKQAAEIDGVLLDLYTASTIHAVYNALSAENREKLRGMTLTRAAAICFALASK